MNIELTLLPSREQGSLERAPFARWRTSTGKLAATVHRTPEGYHIRFLDRADFAVSLARSMVTCTAVPGVSTRAVNDLYLNQVQPMIRGQCGELIIHASAVLADAGVLGFVAPSGYGKSTLAAAFARDSGRFLSDDGLTLTVRGRRYLAHPNRPSFRLWQDTQAAIGLEISDEEWHSVEKSHVEADDRLLFEEEPGALRVLYFLGAGDTLDITIDAMPAQRAMAELLNHSFLLDVEDRSRLAGHFAALGQLVESVPCFALDYPRKYALLSDVVAAVSRHAKETTL